MRRWSAIAAAIVIGGAAVSVPILTRGSPRPVASTPSALGEGISVEFVGETPDKSMGPISGPASTAPFVWLQFSMPGQPPVPPAGSVLVYAPVFGVCTAADIVEVRRGSADIEVVVSSTCAEEGPGGGPESVLFAGPRTLFVLGVPGDEVPNPTVTIR